MSEIAYIGCLIGTEPPTAPSRMVACAKCGYPVWLSEQSASNLPNAVPVCMACLVLVSSENDIGWAGIQPWQRPEVSEHTGLTGDQLDDLDDAAHWAVTRLADAVRRLRR